MQGRADAPSQGVVLGQRGVEGLPDDVLVGDVAEGAAGVRERADPRRGGEEDRQDRRAGDRPGVVQPEVGLADLDGVAINSGRCQGVGGLAHRALRE